MLRKFVGELGKQRMLLLFWLLFVALTARSAQAGRHVSIKQFEQGLAEAKSKPDREFARWVYGFELNERVSGVRLARWKEGIEGKEGLRALGAVADLSAFQNLPGEEIPKKPALDKDGQQRVIAAAGVYVEQTLAKLPNFFATQAVTTFEDTPDSRANDSFTPYEPLHYADFVSATVHYRNGKEIMETRKGVEQTESDQTASVSAGLLPSGEFGPVLQTVLADAQAGKLAWSHWETLGEKTMTVFRYSVSQGKSHYLVKVVLPGSSSLFRTKPAYHGEIGIDPETGAILRLTLRAEMTDEVPLDNANLMVEYGPVEIGGKSYICPVRSVASVEAYQVLTQAATTGNGREHGSFQQRSKENAQVILNDAIFGHYQVLRSEAKVLTGADMDDQDKP
jgi:hypothetical protein